ncbi:MAG: bile acid:sodium symporter family protein [Planctomycetaceae bacterium]|nr:bile acid:sodium symporter family protein [Planctomycetaceae bacterium]
MLQRHLLFWFVLSSGLAWIWPQLMGAFGFDGNEPHLASEAAAFDPFLIQDGETGKQVPRFSIGLLVATAMFCIGALLPRDEVNQVLRRWPVVLGGTLVQYTAMPLLSLTFALLFQLPRELFIGVVLVGCVPGAMASNVLTLAARGNVSYSVSLTTLATLVSPLVVPVAMRLALQTQASIDAAGVSLQLLREVVAPVIAGYLLCRQSPRLAASLPRMAGPIANLTILWIIATVVAANRDRMQHTPLSVLAALLALNAFGYLAGHFGGVLLRLPEGMRRALTLEVGMQNAGVGTALALKWFSDTPSAAIPTAVYTFGCMLTGTILARWFASQSDIGPRDSAAGERADVDTPARRLTEPPK